MKSVRGSIILAWFRNYYVCPVCCATWDDQWSSMSDDTCAECECSDISPVSSDDLSVVVDRNASGDYDICVSGNDAEDTPMYRTILSVSAITISASANLSANDLE